MVEELSQEAFIAHYEALSDKIFRTCYFKTGDREVAIDLTQETFIKVWNYLVSGKEIDNLQSFTYAVARNLIKDFYKRKKSIPMGHIHNFDPGLIVDPASSGIEEGAEVEQMLLLLEKLSEEDKRLLTYRLIEELSPKEIAEKTGERENTISVRVHRALKRYRALLEGSL